MLYNYGMPLHLLKLSVGTEDVEGLERWQAMRLREHGRVFHVTRMYPKRAEEILKGGSIYWVIRRFIQVRQRITQIERFTDDEGIGRCRLVFDPELVRTRPDPRRPHQGWRYFHEDDAPPDLDADISVARDMPPAMRAELRALCLI